MLTTAGLLHLAKLIGNVDSVTHFTYCAIGTGTTAESVGLTQLTTEKYRVASTVTYEATNKTVWTTTFTIDATWALREVGIFSASSSGTMLLRHLWSVDRGVDAGDTAIVTVKLTSAAA